LYQWLQISIRLHTHTCEQRARLVIGKSLFRV